LVGKWTIAVVAINAGKAMIGWDPIAGSGRAKIYVAGITITGV